jgi:hypothetical protein
VTAYLLSLALLVLAALPPVVAAPARLEAHTRAAFDRYAALTAARVENQSQPAGSFLYLQHAAGSGSEAILARLRGGELYYEKLETTNDDGTEVEIRDGLIHHWLGAAFIPGATLDAVMAFVQDYDRHDQIFPEVVESSLLSRDGDVYRAFLRFRKEKVITVVMNTEHEARYVRVTPDRAYSLSRSIRVQEVEDAGSPTERELPDGEGHGFMWAMDSSWRFLERDGGVYVECESVTLTRTIPFLLRWIVSPFVNDVPRQSLESLLEITREELRTDQ